MAASVEAIKKKANSFFEMEQYAKAIILYNQAIHRAPHASVLYGNRAAAFMKRKWWEDSSAVIRAPPLDECSILNIFMPPRLKGGI